MAGGGVGDACAEANGGGCCGSLEESGVEYGMGEVEGDGEGGAQVGGRDIEEDGGAAVADGMGEVADGSCSDEEAALHHRCNHYATMWRMVELLQLSRPGRGTSGDPGVHAVAQRQHGLI